MKRLLRGAAATAIAISLTSCGSSGESGSPFVPAKSAAPKSVATATPSAAPSATPTPVITAMPVPTPIPTPTPTPQTLTTADDSVQPTLICIGHRPWDGRYYLRFGYDSNESNGVLIGVDSVDGTTQMNKVIVTPVDGSTPYEFTAQPTLFQTGAGNIGFDVAVNQKDTVTWYLDGNTLNATTNGAVQCT